MNCRKCGKPGGEQITDMHGNFLIRCRDCMMDLAREVEQAIADGVEVIMECENKIDANNARIAELQREQDEDMKEGAIRLYGECADLRTLAVINFTPEHAERVKEAARIAMTAARKVLTRRARHTRRAAHTEMMKAMEVTIQVAMLAKRKGTA